MNVWDLTAGLRRRWPLTVLAVLGVIGLTFATFSVVKPSYETKASVVLLPPKGGAAQTLNPYLALGNLGAAVDVLAGTMNTQTVRDQLTKGAPSTEFAVTRDPSASAPFLQIDVTSPDAAQAMRVMRELVALTPQKLQAMQDKASVDSPAYITTSVVSEDPKPQVVQKTRVRLTAATGLASMIIFLTLVLTLDDWLVRRNKAQGGDSSGTGAKGGESSHNGTGARKQTNRPTPARPRPAAAQAKTTDRKDRGTRAAGGTTAARSAPELAPPLRSAPTSP